MDSVKAKEQVMEKVSRRLCRVLDGLGYSEIVVQIRRQAVRHETALCNTLYGHTGMRIVIVGSTGEGISRLYESDTDIIYILSDIACIAYPMLSPVISEQNTVFAIRPSYPGYCTLELLRLGSIIDPMMVNSVVPYRGKSLLSSKLWKSEFQIPPPPDTSSTCMTGPAQTDISDTGDSYDNVYTLPSICHDILQKWSSRPRKYDWPPVSLRQAVENMNGNLVATGKEDSETEHLEWRFCFNEIELLLTESLNETQTKLYKMLKFINTDMLKRKEFGVTSYMLKTLVFWLAESYPQCMFQPQTLFKWILKCLRLLKRAVRLNCIPYFMIPERNLLLEKVGELQRKPLYDHLSDLIKAGPKILYTCKRIREVEHMGSLDLRVLQEKNYECEMLHFFCVFRYKKIAYENDVDDSALNDDAFGFLDDKWKCSLNSGWPRQIQEKLDSCSNFLDKQNGLVKGFSADDPNVCT